MSEPVDLSHLPKSSYWRTGVPDLLGTDLDLASRALLGSIHPRHLRIELAIEGVPIDPRVFARHLQQWCTEFMECRIRAVLMIVAEALEGPCTEEELQALSSYLSRQALRRDVLGPDAGEGGGA